MTQSLSGVLLVEDDEGDALLVRECLREAGVADGDVTWRRTVRDGIAALGVTIPPACCSTSASPTRRVSTRCTPWSPRQHAIPVIVLTGPPRPHRRRGGRGRRPGLPGQGRPHPRAARPHDPVRRPAAPGPAHRVPAARGAAARRRERPARARPAAPAAAAHRRSSRCASHYRPGRARAVLGGDFFDVVETADGRIRAVIGDVMGHGPDEAALGVHLRVAWRALVLADVPDDQILATLSRLLEAESTGGIFVTVCDLTLDRDLGLTVRVAGHPPPLLCAARRGAATSTSRSGRRSAIRDEASTGGLAGHPHPARPRLRAGPLHRRAARGLPRRRDRDQRRARRAAGRSPRTALSSGEPVEQLLDDGGGVAQPGTRRPTTPRSWSSPSAIAGS